MEPIKLTVKNDPSILTRLCKCVTRSCDVFLVIWKSCNLGRGGIAPDLVCQRCCNETPHMVAEIVKMYCLQLWRLEVGDEGVGKAGCS